MAVRRVLHACIGRFDLHAVFFGFGESREVRHRHRRLTDPWPQLFPYRAEAQALPVLDPIDDRAVIAIIPHREVHIAAVIVALDDNLVVSDGMTHYGSAAQASRASN